MSGNPYAPSENWNTGESRAGGGVPLWALLVACLSSLAFGCFGGIAGGFAIGFVAGGDYLGSDTSVVARVVYDDVALGRVLEVLIANNTEQPITIDTIDVYHSLASPDEITATSPAFYSTQQESDPGVSSSVYTSYFFDPMKIMPGRTLIVHFAIDDRVTADRSGDVDVWVGDSFITAHVHVDDSAPAPRVSEPGY